MLIKTKDGWREWDDRACITVDGMIPPSEGRVFYVLEAEKRGDVSRVYTRSNDKEDKRKEESWFRNVCLNLHRAAFPSGFHAGGSECTQTKEPQGCPFKWNAKYLAAL